MTPAEIRQRLTTLWQEFHALEETLSNLGAEIRGLEQQLENTVLQEKDPDNDGDLNALLKKFLASGKDEMFF